MQMNAGRVAGASHITDLFAFLDDFAHRGVQLVHEAVKHAVTIVMIDDHAVTVIIAVSGEDHFAVIGSENIFVAGDEVHSLVELAPSLAESARHREGNDRVSELSGSFA